MRKRVIAFLLSVALITGNAPELALAMPTGGTLQQNQLSVMEETETETKETESETEEIETETEETETETETEETEAETEETEAETEETEQDTEEQEPALGSEYEIHFNSNGGIGSMSNQKMILGTSQPIEKINFNRTGYKFAGWSLKGEAVQKDFSDKQEFDGIGYVQKENLTLEFYAVWELIPYKITYSLAGGKNASSNPAKYNVITAKTKLKNPTRKAYDFKGWYTDKKYKKQVKYIGGGAHANISLYAKWQPTTYKITYKLNGGKNSKSNPTKYNITSKKIKFKNPTRSSYYFLGWYSDKKFKKAVTNIKSGSTGNRTLYAKWVKEYNATSTSAKINSCKAVSKNTIQVTATVKKRIKSSDTKYYLVTIDPVSGNILKRAGVVNKKTDVKFSVDVRGNRAFALAKYAIAIKKNGKYVRISSVSSYIKNPEKLASYTKAYKKGATKKGIQTTDITTAGKTGSDNVFLNLSVSTILSNASQEPVRYKYNGKNYTFGGVGGYRVAVSEANRKKMNVTIQVCLDEQTWNYDSNLIASEAREGGHLYYTWNTKDRAAREKMEAIFSYLSEIFGKSDCLVSNWILGNEVNSAAIWNYRGSMSDEDFIQSYAYSFRSMYNAVRSVSANSRVYTCVDNIWNRQPWENHGFNAGNFLDRFSSAINSQQRGVEWNIAYHPYSVRIDHPEFWNPESYYNNPALVMDNESSEFITMKNLDVFTNYVKVHYGSDKRIIISEVGFDAGNPTNQAAALAYAYNKAACNNMIDAFIIRSFQDEAGDGQFHFGICGREAYKVYCKMDTKSAEKYTNKYLQTIGIGSWKSAIPNYSVSRLTKNK